MRIGAPPPPEKATREWRFIKNCKLDCIGQILSCSCIEKRTKQYKKVAGIGPFLEKTPLSHTIESAPVKRIGAILFSFGHVEYICRR